MLLFYSLHLPSGHSPETHLNSKGKDTSYNIPMLEFNAPITDIIYQRFSCRSYRREPVIAEKREQLKTFIEALPPGPFDTQPRFDLLAATEGNGHSLRGLGTYGFIKNPPAFIVGVMSPAKNDLEDYGYLMEAIILYATSLDLGTCWLGGTFTKSSFARKMNLSDRETMPAVTSVGDYANPERKRRGIASRTAGSEQRLPWRSLFFDRKLDAPLNREVVNEYSTALEMVRLGPSASNKQPWRIIRHDRFWRFYLRRTPGYREDLIKRILDLCDLQRLDMGIAMCHFELTARELGLEGDWVIEEDVEENPDGLTEYLVSWESRG